MRTTENLNLKLYEGTDRPNYSTYNESMQIIDDAHALQQNKNSVYDNLVELVDDMNETLTNQGADLSSLSHTIEQRKVIVNSEINLEGNYSNSKDLLITLPLNATTDDIQITNGVMRFKRQGKFQLIFNVISLLDDNSVENIANNPASIGRLRSRFLLLSNAQLQNNQYVGGTQHIVYDWFNGSMNLVFDIDITQNMVNNPLYPVLRGVGGYVGYEIVNEDNSCRLSIERIS